MTRLPACPHCGAPKEAEPASETTAALQVERSVEDIRAELKEEKSASARLRLIEELEERLEKEEGTPWERFQEEEARKKTKPPPPRNPELVRALDALGYTGSSSPSRTIDQGAHHLISCNDCSKEVSDTALNCPHCGSLLRYTYPIPLSGRIITGILILAIVLMLITGYRPGQ